MNSSILSYGPPPLTLGAADAALDVIHFIATAVRGYDAIEVTNTVRPLWRSHLAMWYPQLPPETRLWYVNAPMALVQITNNWPYLDPWTRNALLQQWTMELPNMLWMLEPVLAQAHAQEMNEATRAKIAAMRQEASHAAPAAPPVGNPIAELNRRSDQAMNLADFGTRMAQLTRMQMNAMKR
jgi:hypothetical protein